LDELNLVSQHINVPKGTELIRDGQYIKVIPIVLKGSIKVYIKHDDKELL